jgi:tRNA (guanine37-N1)-methyltransferase
MRFDVVSIFPEVFEPVFRQGVVGRAIARGLVSLHAHDLRDYTTDRHRQVDDAPFGGGAGMVLKPEPIFAAVDALRPRNPGPVVLMEPWGEPLTQALARDLTREPGLIVVCGRYEGVDDRVRQALADREVSIGDYVPWSRMPAPPAEATRSSPGPPTGAASRSPTCCSQATTPRSPTGAERTPGPPIPR